MTRRVAILISGGGSNMEALVRSMSGDHPARPALVVSSDRGARGLARARDLGVEALAVHRPDHPDRVGFEAALEEALCGAGAEIVCLAGFMWILSPPFVARWSGRMLNIHPSLLPLYPGLDTHARALRAGDVEAGCTVHQVVSEVDAGPVLGQTRVPVEPGDTAETLAARVLAAEHTLYPAVLRRFAAGDRTPLFLP